MGHHVQESYPSTGGGEADLMSTDTSNRQGSQQYKKKNKKKEKESKLFWMGKVVMDGKI